MTEPAAALTSAASRAFELARDDKPRRALGGDAAYNAVYLGTWLVGVIALWQVVPVPAVCLVAALAPAAPATWLVDRLWIAPRKATAFNVASIPAAEASGRGLLDEAEAAYRALAAKYRSRPGLHAFALYQLAIVVATRGDFARAIAMMEAIDAFPGTKRQPAIVALAPRCLALFEAQRGDVAAARRWLDAAKKRHVAGRWYDAHIEALVLAREGRHAEAIAAYDAERVDLERVLPVPAMRSILVRRAFSLSHLPDRREEAARAARGIEPSRPDELEHVGHDWPEMRSFLVEHRLIGPRAEL